MLLILLPYSIDILQVFKIRELYLDTSINGSLNFYNILIIRILKKNAVFH